jgi:hypothetical protein
MIPVDTIKLAALYESLGEVPLQNTTSFNDDKSIPMKPDHMDDSNQVTLNDLFELFPTVQTAMKAARYGSQAELQQLSDSIKQMDSILDQIL